MQELWVEKYRPKTIAECILPESIKTIFQGYVDQRKIPNLILTGKSGVGKTSVAKAVVQEIDSDFLVINASLARNIDTLRTEISDFASSVSFSGRRKYLILDEADNLNHTSTQPALRAFMEDFSDSCGFILTCNNKNRIIKPLHSRCAVIDFTIPKDEKIKLATEFEDRLKTILETEGISYDPAVLPTLITKHFPDFRHTINEIQAYAVNGKIDAGILVGRRDSVLDLLKHMKNADWAEMRKWCAKNSDSDFNTLIREIYDHSNRFDPKSLPNLVLILAEWQYKSSFSADQEIVMVACFSEIMAECKVL